jgi:hypothetical protein
MAWTDKPCVLGTSWRSSDAWTEVHGDPSPRTVLRYCGRDTCEQLSHMYLGDPVDAYSTPSVRQQAVQDRIRTARETSWSRPEYKLRPLPASRSSCTACGVVIRTVYRGSAVTVAGQLYHFKCHRDLFVLGLPEPKPRRNPSNPMPQCAACSTPVRTDRRIVVVGPLSYHPRCAPPPERPATSE